jgi:hypothetical protein
MEVQNPMVFFVTSEVEREHRPSSGDCDIWLGLKFEGRWGVSSTNLKFRTPTCIEPNHAQIPMRMEAGFQVFTSSTEIPRKLEALNSPAGSPPGSHRNHPSPGTHTGTVLRRKGPRCRAWRRALAPSAPFQRTGNATGGSGGIPQGELVKYS